MTDLTATPETGPVDAPASMDSILAEFDADTSPPEDAADAAVREMVEQADDGDADAPGDSEGDTETAEDEAEDPEEGTPEDETEATEDPRYTVKVNGEDQEVPLSELLKGYSRTEDYKAKTMALAEERRSYQSNIEAEYSSKLQQTADLFLKMDPILSEAANIDWQALAQEDPATYTQLRAAYDARVQVLGQAQAEIQRVTEAQKAQAEEQYAAGFMATEEALRESNPALADKATFDKYVGDGVSTLISIGLPANEMKAVLSNPDVAPQVFNLVHDALKFRAQQAAKATLPQKKVVPVSPVKPLKSDASSSNKSPRKLRSTASLAERASFVANEFLQG